MDLSLHKKINSLYSKNDKMKDFNGYILIKNENKILYEQSFGMADFSKMQPHNCDTIFGIASMTKQFTAMCILILEKQGLLSIEDCIIEYLDDFKKGAHIRIRDILNQISGMPEYWNKPTWREDDNTTQEDIYNFIKSLTNYEPVGKQFRYCNSNYIVLGVLIEKVSGMNYADYLKKYIFKPLDMNRSGCLPYSKNLDNVAIGYQSPRLGPPIERKLLLTTFAAGNIYSTAADLSKWDAALYTERFVNHDRINQMFTPVLGNYGMGWFIDNRIAQHGGDLPGFSTRIMRFFDSKSLVIMLCNTDGCAESNMMHYSDLVLSCIEL